MSKQKIKAIFFDLGNVLIKINPLKLEQGYSKYGKIKKNEIIEYFLDSYNMNKYMEGKLSSSKFFMKTKKMFNLKIQYNDFYNIWNNIFSHYLEMEKILETLKTKYQDIKLILVSNTNEEHYEFIKSNYNILEYFDNIIVSHKFGYQKPHHKIFQKALNCAQIHQKYVFYTDDRLDLIESARNMGIRAYQFINHDILISQLKKFDIAI